MKTVYCMNEAEMVDVALGILIEVTSVQSCVASSGRQPQDSTPLLAHISSHFWVAHCTLLSTMSPSASLHVQYAVWGVPHVDWAFGAGRLVGRMRERERERTDPMFGGNSVLVCIQRGHQVFTCLHS